MQATEGKLCTDPSLYRCLVGKLNFLTHTRTDLAYIVQHLSQFMQNPRVPHFDALMHTLKYVGYIAGQGIIYYKDIQILIGEHVLILESPSLVTSCC